MDANLQTPLGRYRLIALLGQGGMADVYLACTRGPGGFQKLQVVKIAKANEDPAFSAMFLDEARLAACLSHPNVVETYEVGDDAGRQYMVMEYLDGPSLFRLSHKAAPQGGIPLRVSLQILSHVLEGLEYAHQAVDYDGKPLKVVHRDLTPHNVIITSQGVCKILDFGIAKVANSVNHTSPGFYRGKITYLPPEQLGSDAVDARADIFSVGVMLAEAISGKPFWGEASTTTVGMRLVLGEIPVVEAPVPELGRILARALAPDREKRYPTARELKADLDACRADIGKPVSREELADFIRGLVAEDRAKMQAVIDKQLRLVADLPADEDRPLDISIVEMPATPTSRRHGKTPRPAPRVVQPPLPTFLGAVPDVPTLVEAVPRRKRRRWVTAALMVGMVVCGVAITAGVVVSRRAPLPPALLAPLPAKPSPSALTTLPAAPASNVATALSPTTDPGPPAPVPSGAPAPPVAPPSPGVLAVRKASIEILASPAEARLTLDGAALDMNPFVGAFPRDNKVHVLLVEAQGYQPSLRRFSLDEDVLLQVRLQHLAQPVAHSRSRAVAKEHPAPLGPVPEAPTPARVESPPSSKRPLDGNIFDDKHGSKRQLDSEIFDDQHKKRTLDTEGP